MNTCSRRGCPASQARVARLEWLDRLSVITARVPVGLTCSNRGEKRLPVGAVARGRAEGHRVP
jgi:hypothetical protein